MAPYGKQQATAWFGKVTNEFKVVLESEKKRVILDIGRTYHKFSTL